MTAFFSHCRGVRTIRATFGPLAIIYSPDDHVCITCRKMGRTLSGWVVMSYCRASNKCLSYQLS